MVSPLDEKKRFIHRISPFTFFLVCVSSALLAGSLLFLITGLIAVAFDFGEGILTLLVFVAFLVGFIIPIIMLKRARKAIGRNQPPDALAPKKESRFNRDKVAQPEVLQEPKFSENTARKTQPKEQPQEPKFSENASHARDGDSTNSEETKEKPQAWYYSDEGKRIGPVSKHVLIPLLKKRKLPPNIMVWRSGMRDWMPAQETELAECISVESPPPLPGKDVANGFAWALALAPLWIKALHYFLAGLYLNATMPGLHFSVLPFMLSKVVEETWYFSAIGNTAVAFVDYLALKAAGWRVNGLLIVLVPVYLYKRDQMLHAGTTRLWVWIGSLVLSLIWL